MDIIAIDPGLVSGCAHVRVDTNDDNVVDIAVLETAELGPIETGEWLDHRLSDLSINNVRLVLERFTITARTGANTQAPWSLEVIGQSKWIMSRFDPERSPLVFLQSPADAKTAMPNPRLRELGLWHRGGKGHANDALRHAGLYLLRQKLIGPRLVTTENMG
jgi:hypothetical protein